MRKRKEPPAKDEAWPLPKGAQWPFRACCEVAGPDVVRVALLSTSEGVGGYETQLADAQRVARQLHVTVKPYPAASLAEIEQALSAMLSDKMQGLLNFQGGLSLFHRRVIIDFVATHRMPAIYQATLFAEAGGLMAHGQPERAARNQSSSQPDAGDAQPSFEAVQASLEP